MKNLIYILTNPEMPKLIKIGRTSNLEQEINSLSFHAGVPADFKCHYCCEVEDGEKAEKTLHVGLGEYLKNTEKGFFETNPKKAKDMLKIWSIREVILDNNKTYTPEKNESSTKDKSKLRRFNFPMLKIDKGSTITFFNDKKQLPDERYVAKVIGRSKIKFEKKETYVSNAAVKILKRDFGSVSNSECGTNFWVYNDEIHGNETLSQRRMRMENENKKRGLPPLK